MTRKDYSVYKLWGASVTTVVVKHEFLFWNFENSYFGEQNINVSVNNSLFDGNCTEVPPSGVRERR